MARAAGEFNKKIKEAQVQISLRAYLLLLCQVQKGCLLISCDKRNGQTYIYCLVPTFINFLNNFV